mmetsp:Transcript_4740/g.11525  ORF Transcript_4740/g.11525 Transcript_4740/m.11525 type:complete len:150 (-) Transcript_4740:780-1229(-)
MGRSGAMSAPFASLRQQPRVSSTRRKLRQAQEHRAASSTAFRSASATPGYDFERLNASGGRGFGKMGRQGQDQGRTERLVCRSKRICVKECAAAAGSPSTSPPLCLSGHEEVGRDVAQADDPFDASRLWFHDNQAAHAGDGEALQHDAQ